MIEIRRFKVGDLVVARKDAPPCVKQGGKLEVKQWGDDPIDLYVECASGQHYLGLGARHFDPYVPLLDMVYITRREHERLMNNDRLLDELHAGGVDNWDGWDDAIERMNDGKGL